MMGSIEHVLKDDDVRMTCVRVLPSQAAVEIEINNDRRTGYLTEADLLALLAALKAEEKG